MVCVMKPIPVERAQLHEARPGQAPEATGAKVCRIEAPGARANTRNFRSGARA